MPSFAPFILNGKCIDVSYEGKGVFKSGNKTVFVDGLLPGEEGETEVSYSRSGTMFGRLRKLTHESEYRIKPACPHFLKCGGCSFQNLDYEEELKFKTKIVHDQLKKLANIDLPVSPCVGMEKETGYRNKIQMVIGRDPHGKAAAGFYAPYSHRLIPIKGCLNDDSMSHAIVSDFVRLLNNLGIDPYDEDRGTGDIRHLIVRTSRSERTVLLGIVTKKDSFPHMKEFASSLLRKHPEIKTVGQSVNPRKTNVILGEKNKVLYGKGYITDSIGGINFRIGLSSFFQTNVLMADTLFAYVEERAGVTKDDVLLDAYAGIGTIGLVMSSKVGSVMSIESVREAVLDARRTAEDAGIGNFSIIEGDATEFIEKAAKQKEKIDVLVMDPPRKGSTPRFLGAALALRPREIIYISCNPGTLARDLTYLVKDYGIAEIQPFDMFPRTHHVETCAILKAKPISQKA